MKLKTSDREIVEFPDVCVNMSFTLQDILEDMDDLNSPILLSLVSSDTLYKIIQFCLLQKRFCANLVPRDASIEESLKILQPFIDNHLEDVVTTDRPSEFKDIILASQFLNITSLTAVCTFLLGRLVKGKSLKELEKIKFP